MTNSETVTDKYKSLLHERSGLNRRIATETTEGTADNPSVILEVNGRSTARCIDKSIKEQRHLALHKLTNEEHSQGYDKVITANLELVDGQVSGEVEKILSSTNIQSVVISHQCEIMSAEQIGELLASSFLALPDGGKIYIVDEIGWGGGKDEYLRACLDALHREVGRGIAITRSLIAPVISKQFGIKIADTSYQNQIEMIMENVRSGSKGVSLEMLPFDLPLKERKEWKNIENRGKKIILSAFADELFTLAKLTSEQIRRRKEREKRAKKRKKRK